MRVTVVVGDSEREVLPDGAPWWQRGAERDQPVPLAPDERDLLEELSRLCRAILLADGLVEQAAD